jgi:hypothetical protein
MYHHPKGSDSYMGFNDLVWSMFQGYKAEKDKRDPYKELEKSWYLYEVKDLKDLTNKARKDEQYNTILDHLYKWDATRVDPYKEIENKIIEEMWD